MGITNFSRSEADRWFVRGDRDSQPKEDLQSLEEDGYITLFDRVSKISERYINDLWVLFYKKDSEIAELIIRSRMHPEEGKMVISKEDNFPFNSFFLISDTELNKLLSAVSTLLYLKFKESFEDIEKYSSLLMETSFNTDDAIRAIMARSFIVYPRGEEQFSNWINFAVKPFGISSSIEEWKTKMIEFVDMFQKKKK